MVTQQSFGDTRSFPVQKSDPRSFELTVISTSSQDYKFAGIIATLKFPFLVLVHLAAAFAPKGLFTDPRWAGQWATHKPHFTQRKTLHIVASHCAHCALVASSHTPCISGGWVALFRMYEGIRIPLAKHNVQLNSTQYGAGWVGLAHKGPSCHLRCPSGQITIRRAG